MPPVSNLQNYIKMLQYESKEEVSTTGKWNLDNKVKSRMFMFLKKNTPGQGLLQNQLIRIRDLC